MPTRVNATIVDVARSAGVSVSTVSKVINARYGVSERTAEHVRRVIAELGYESSLGARSLRSQRTGVLGVLVAEFEPFSTELLKGLGQAAEGSGYELLAYSGRIGPDPRYGWELRSLARLSGTLIDGAVLVTPTVSDPDYRIPVVALDPHAGSSSMPTIDSDSLTGAELAVNYLLSLGHRRIAMLAGRPDLNSAQLREAGYRRALQAAGIPVDPTLIEIGGFRPDSATAPARALLDRPDRPTAVFAANDLTAIRTIEVANELGLRVPEDLSVVGFDDVPDASQFRTPLTTIAQPLYQMGRLAMETLLRLLEGAELEESHLTLATTLVVRESTAPVPSR
ncbi:LacI family DNA-binding transcriptional regulator [Propionicimonas paludicola]|uniref:LacI family DNA-binding transcriptional regulator n=1 Tax=Propionicimonas paludicola TaxID=185243 RepID=UPI001FEB3201|nr:LacI family DNA-binding transcriptional regulator [Propionicimonas paludicola]